MPEGWAVKDGALTRVAKTTDIVSDEEFENFDLQFDWKLAKNGNSGVFFTSSSHPSYKEVYFTGPEYQLLDNDGHPDGKNGPDRFSGANYALHAPSQNTVHTPGEWNQSRIVVNNGHVEHWLNGVKVVEYELWSNDWKTRVANSKFKAWPDYGMAKTGRLALQEHGIRGRVQEHQNQAVTGQGNELTGEQARPEGRALHACRSRHLLQ